MGVASLVVLPTCMQPKLPALKNIRELRETIDYIYTYPVSVYIIYGETNYRSQWYEQL